MPLGMIVFQLSLRVKQAAMSSTFTWARQRKTTGGNPITQPPLVAVSETFFLTINSRTEKTRTLRNIRYQRGRSHLR